jgi:hypothetical protein
MSVHVQSLVYSRKFGGVTPKLIALKLADHADDYGRNIFPAVARIAAECEVSERQVQRVLHAMVDDGVLRRVSDGRGGRSNPTRYEFDLERVRALPPSMPNPDTMSPIAERVTSSERVTSEHERVTYATGKGDKLCHPNHQEPSLEPSGYKATASPAFPSKADIEWAVELFNDMAHQAGIPRVKLLTDQRRKRLQARLKQLGSREEWEATLRHVYASDFCRGRNDRGWKADFDFVLQEKSFARLHEGFYANGGGP